MPTYDYYCPQCDKDFDVIKSIKEYDPKEKCLMCDTVGERIIRPKIHLVGEKVTDAYFNNGLGEVVKNKHHKTDICKKLNVEEVGSDYGSGLKMDREYVEDRKKKVAKGWDSI